MLLSSPRDNLRSTQDSRKARFYKGYRCCGKLSNVLDFKWYATHMQQVCNTNINDMYRTFFSSDTGECPFFLRVPTSGVAVSEYFEMMLASIEKYLLSDIARQRDMSKIALQSANDRLELNSINRIDKLLYIKVGIYFFGQSHCTGVPHNFLNNRLINTGFCQHGNACVSATMWCSLNVKLLH